MTRALRRRGTKRAGSVKKHPSVVIREVAKNQSDAALIWLHLDQHRDINGKSVGAGHA